MLKYVKRKVGKGGKDRSSRRSSRRRHSMPSGLPTPEDLKRLQSPSHAVEPSEDGADEDWSMAEGLEEAAQEEKDAAVDSFLADSDADMDPDFNNDPLAAMMDYHNSRRINFRYNVSNTSNTASNTTMNSSNGVPSPKRKNQKKIIAVEESKEEERAPTAAELSRFDSFSNLNNGYTSTDDDGSISFSVDELDEDVSSPVQQSLLGSRHDDSDGEDDDTLGPSTGHSSARLNNSLGYSSFVNDTSRKSKSKDPTEKEDKDKKKTSKRAKLKKAVQKLNPRRRQGRRASTGMDLTTEVSYPHLNVDNQHKQEKPKKEKKEKKKEKKEKKPKKPKDDAVLRNLQEIEQFLQVLNTKDSDFKKQFLVETLTGRSGGGMSNSPSYNNAMSASQKQQNSVSSRTSPSSTQNHHRHKTSSSSSNNKKAPRRGSVSASAREYSTRGTSANVQSKGGNASFSGFSKMNASLPTLGEEKSAHFRTPFLEEQQTAMATSRRRTSRRASTGAGPITMRESGTMPSSSTARNGKNRRSSTTDLNGSMPELSPIMNTVIEDPLPREEKKKGKNGFKKMFHGLRRKSGPGMDVSASSYDPEGSSSHGEHARRRSHHHHHSDAKGTTKMSSSSRRRASIGTPAEEGHVHSSSRSSNHHHHGDAKGTTKMSSSSRRRASIGTPAEEGHVHSSSRRSRSKSKSKKGEKRHSASLTPPRNK